MQMLSPLVLHLITWGKARLLHPLTEHSVLTVHPEAPRDTPPPHFRNVFGAVSDPPYATVLRLFQRAHSFGATIRAAELEQLPKR